MAGAVKKVLVVEDEKPLAGALELKLKKQGYQVAVAHNGQVALELMASESYDVALLDLVMPVMDGFEVLEAARKLQSAPVFIVLSNLTQPDDASRAIRLGAYKFLVKSDTPLAAIVQEIAAL